MKNFPFILSIFLLFICFETNGQIRKRPDTKVQKIESEQMNPLDRFTFDIKLGNVGFFRNLFLSGKGNAGYKLNDWLSAGVGSKIFYTQIFITGAPDDKYTDWGGFIYSRGKIFENFFLQLEYHYTSFAYQNFQYPGASIDYPTIGGGYMSGGNKWKFGIELNFIIDELARDYQGSVLEYWVGATYNF